ncbi:hypothetical protein Cva_00664 [Caedimonas varicaedens]|uniref:Uncharacterized protein n=1 Tax=Caedimonas varicaedens TaxID=1629334 RepID=A0A0K8MBZ0_9PROT|nr:hypothetical protein Cva_00664 [Caedimonas varicaedens]
MFFDDRLRFPFIFDRDNVTFSEGCATLLNKRFDMSYTCGGEYQKDYVELKEDTDCKISHYKSRQLKGNCYDSNAKFTDDKKDEIRQLILKKRRIVNAPYLLWDCLLSINAQIKQNADEKYTEPLDAVSMFDLEMGDVWSDFQKNNFESYLSADGKKNIYPTISYKTLTDSLDHYYLILKRESKTDYKLNSFLWASHQIVENDLLPIYKQRFPESFNMHSRIGSLQDALQKQFDTEKTHSKELATQLRILNSAINDTE